VESLFGASRNVDSRDASSPTQSLTVAYVPSPSFSSCWKELGCLLSISTGGSVSSRFRMLIVLGTEKKALARAGGGGKVRNGGEGEGRCRVVNLGSKRTVAGVQMLFRISNASFDEYNEAVVKGV
jgi:hypothetical protein